MDRLQAGDPPRCCYSETTTGVSFRRQLGCWVKADSDLGAIGDVDLIARLQALDEGLHSRILHVDSVGHAVRAGEGDAGSVGGCGNDGYARTVGDATSSIRRGL